ncbi:hypothetical protein V8E36_007354 [Tilletia maclaganii]
MPKAKKKRGRLFNHAVALGEGPAEHECQYPNEVSQQFVATPGLGCRRVDGTKNITVALYYSKSTRAHGTLKAFRPLSHSNSQGPYTTSARRREGFRSGSLCCSAYLDTISPLPACCWRAEAARIFTVHGIELFTSARNGVQADAGVPLMCGDMRSSVWDLC